MSHLFTFNLCRAFRYPLSLIPMFSQKPWFHGLERILRVITADLSWPSVVKITSGDHGFHGQLEIVISDAPMAWIGSLREELDNRDRDL